MDAVVVDKEAPRRHSRRIRRIGTLFRCLEVLAAAAALLLSWSSSHLSLDPLRRVAVGLLGPCPIFLIANAIVLLLIAKSGRLSLSPASAAAADCDGGGGGAIYEEFLEIRRRFSTDSLPPPEEVVFEDKAVCVETRTLSEKAATGKQRRAKRELQQAETDVGPRKRGEGPETQPPPAEEEEEEEDAEEFRRTIDAFIAKHTMFRREEAVNAIVLSAAAAEPTCTLICSAGTPEPSVLK